MVLEVLNTSRSEKEGWRKLWPWMAWSAQSIKWLATGWTTGNRFPTCHDSNRNVYLLPLCPDWRCGYPASWPVAIKISFLGCKAAGWLIISIHSCVYDSVISLTEVQLCPLRNAIHQQSHFGELRCQLYVVLASNVLLSESESESELLYDWRFTANQFVLAASPLRFTTSNFIFQPKTCGPIPYVPSSLMREWVYRLQLLLALASIVIWGPSPAGLMTIFYCLRFETPPIWRVRAPNLYPPGTGWPGYTPRHWVPFSSPPRTRRATVEVFDPASTRECSTIVVFVLHL
jgi:hypothetical protein